MTSLVLPKQSNGVKIGDCLFRVANLKEAVELWERTRDELNLGASESPSVTACIDSRLYRISYNGRVWDPATDLEVIP